MAGSKSNTLPSYRLHKASGQAVVTINRKDHYLGKHGSPESRVRYERLIGQWLQSGTVVREIEPDSCGDITVAEVANLYRKWAETYYVKDGKVTTEYPTVCRAIKGLRECYAALPARQFSPVKLKTVRERFVAADLARVTVNRLTTIIIRLFAYGVENELVPAAVWHSLKSIRPLQRGRSAARETDPVGPVADSAVDATLPFLEEPFRTMVRVQTLLACRPGELCTMTLDQIDRTGEVWLYRPRSFKTQHHEGKTRIIPIGPRVQLLLRPMLPAFEAMPIFRGKRGKQIVVTYYRQMIYEACDRAGIERWHPNQLRHSGASKIRQQASLDAAQVILGHSTISMTQHYAERNVEAAVQIAAKIG